MEKMLLGNESIDLRLCLMDSAQCFHFAELENGFAGVVRGQIVLLWQENGGVYARSSMDAAELRHFLDLDRDYGALAREFAHIPAAERAIALYPGLRVLNQDPWEALLAFILSANNNVRRIRSLVEALCGALGDTFELDGHVLHGFPSPEKLAACSEEELRALGMGYRAPYLIRTAGMVAGGFPLNELCRMEYSEAHARLTELAGVGDKVADCVLLFGCRQASAFPVDTWVEKLLADWFGIGGKNRRESAEKARALLGDHAGLIQQFLFHAARTGGISVAN